MNDIFYVYVIMDPTIKKTYFFGEVVFYFEPFYVGKGSGERMHDHVKVATGIKSLKNNGNRHKINRINKIIKSGHTPIVKKIFDNLLEDQAKEVEKVLIELLGRRDNKTGCLTNMTDGGDGCRGLSTESKAKISNSLKGNIPWNKGKTGIYSKETRKRISNSLSGRRSKPLTEYQKECISKAQKGKFVSEETKKKISESNKGRVVWNKGTIGMQVAWNKGLRKNIN